MVTEAKRIPFTIPLPNGLNRAIDLLGRSNAKCRIVGGSVRDSLLELAPKDFDIEVYGLPLGKIADTLRSIGKTDLVGQSFCVVKLWIEGGEYDFAIPRRESKTALGHRGFDIQPNPNLSEREALQRRDFTINALLYDSEKNEIIDYFGGLADLEAKRLRHISPAFSEDPLRVLRAMQFAGRFGFDLDADTANLCRSMRHEYWALAEERIAEEWKKWAIKSQYPSKGLQALHDSGWLVFFSELNALVGMSQDPEWHPEGDVWIHTGKCLDALMSSSAWSTSDRETKCILAFAVLCHDLGKARCTRFSNKRGRLRWTSNGHDQASRWLSYHLLERIGIPMRYREKVAKLVANHHFLNAFVDTQPSRSSLRRLSNRLKPATMDELYNVMMADHMGRPPRVSEQQSERLANFSQMIEELEIARAAPRQFVQGRHLVEMGLEPSPDFKTYLATAYDAQLEGEFDSEESGIKWLQRYFKR